VEPSRFVVVATMQESEAVSDESPPPLPAQPPPPPRVQYMVESESTELQQETEAECEPFFVDLKTLPVDQVRHLRNVGLLPAENPSAAAAAATVTLDEVTEDVATSRSGNDDYGVHIEVLEEHTDDEMREECNDSDEDGAFRIQLLRGKHSEYLTRALTLPLPPSYVSLDASRPWIIYWTLHSLDMLGSLPDETALVNVVKALDSCWEDSVVYINATEIRNDAVLKDIVEAEATSGKYQGKIPLPAGGFGGNGGQIAHCAPTYAAVLALCIVYSAGVDTSAPSSTMALNLLRSKRQRLCAWYLSLRCDMPLLTALSGTNNTISGERSFMTAYRMHHDGEVDCRATYTMLAVAVLLNINSPLLFSARTADFVASCQTYEGGFGGEPHSEAHGGYTFCAIAALKLLEEKRLSIAPASVSGDLESERRVEIDRAALRAWIARRQMSYEGGFAGRCNKLVDGCYSFWQGGAMAVLDIWSNGSEGEDSRTDGIFDDLCFDREKLQRYILLCAQDVNGGLRDKPSKPRDFYHSCYNLSGLSVTQHCLSNSLGDSVAANAIGETHPVLNIRVERVREIQKAFN